ncbi:MAG: hypothetical protein ABIM89_10335 [Mycobacteriales bacterium]
MPKARLRYAIAIDATEYSAGSQDPVIYVFGSAAGSARPFLVRRGWTGPQGSYVEQFRIVESGTRITRYRSEKRVIELTGEYYSDDFEDRVGAQHLAVGEYELVFTIAGEVVPGVPVFVSPGPGAIGGPPAVVPSIIDEATKKSDLVWLAVAGLPGQSHRPVWHIWEEGAAYVVYNGSEQLVPGLAEADAATVTVRSKDKGGRLVSWRAAVDDIAPGTALWEAVVPLLVGKRLNSKDGDGAAARWARECKVARLTPTGELVDDPASPPSGSQSAPPAPTEAATTTRIPINFNGSVKRGFSGRKFGSRSKDAKPEDSKA